MRMRHVEKNRMQCSFSEAKQFACPKTKEHPDCQIYCTIELMMPDALKILFLSAEAEPFVKVGGLADVAGSLPLALRSLTDQDLHGRKLDVRLVLPLHRTLRAESATLHLVAEFPVYRLGGDVPAQVFELSLAGMPVYFISGEPISSAASVYSQDPAVDLGKFAFFSLAALEMTRYMAWHPDLLHANDWHTALALYALRAHPIELYERTHALRADLA